MNNYYFVSFKLVTETNNKRTETTECEVFEGNFFEKSIKWCKRYGGKPVIIWFKKLNRKELKMYNKIVF